MTEEVAKKLIWNRINEWKNDTNEKQIMIPKPQYFMTLGALLMGAPEENVRTQLDIWIQSEIKRIREERKKKKSQTGQIEADQEDLPF